MIPLLVETNQSGSFDAVVVVDASPEVQRQRLRERDGLAAEEAEARIAAQATREQRLAVADVVIVNTAVSREDLRQQVVDAYRELTSSD
jgi:dephospho-CoA kinase